MRVRPPRQFRSAGDGSIRLEVRQCEWKARLEGVDSRDGEGGGVQVLGLSRICDQLYFALSFQAKSRHQGIEHQLRLAEHKESHKGRLRGQRSNPSSSGSQSSCGTPTLSAENRPGEEGRPPNNLACYLNSRRALSTFCQQAACSLLKTVDSTGQEVARGWTRLGLWLEGTWGGGWERRVWLESDTMRLRFGKRVVKVAKWW